MVEVGKVYRDVDNINRQVMVEAVSHGCVYPMFVDDHPSGEGIVLLGVRLDPMSVDRFVDQWV